MMLTFVQKNEVNRSSHSGDISCKRINQFDSDRIERPKFDY